LLILLLAKIGGSVKLLTIAITGAPGAGKSSACRLFKELGSFVVSADDLVHKLLENNLDVIHRVSQLLGDKVKKDGKLDRNAIAEKVFSDTHKLLQLEKILYPHVQKEMKKYYDQAKNDDYPLFIAEVPLLFEAGFEKLFDQVILVTADESICKMRWNDEKKSSSDYDRRKSRFMAEDKKINQSNYIIKNNQGFAELKAQVHQLFDKLTH